MSVAPPNPASDDAITAARYMRAPSPLRPLGTAAATADAHRLGGEPGETSEAARGVPEAVPGPVPVPVPVPVPTPAAFGDSGAALPPPMPSSSEPNPDPTPPPSPPPPPAALSIISQLSASARANSACAAANLCMARTSPAPNSAWNLGSSSRMRSTMASYVALASSRRASAARHSGSVVATDRPLAEITASYLSDKISYSSNASARSWNVSRTAPMARKKSLKWGLSSRTSSAARSSCALTPVSRSAQSPMALSVSPNSTHLLRRAMGRPHVLSHSPAARAATPSSHSCVELTRWRSCAARSFAARRKFTTSSSIFFVYSTIWRYCGSSSFSTLSVVREEPQPNQPPADEDEDEAEGRVVVFSDAAAKDADDDEDDLAPRAPLVPAGAPPTPPMPRAARKASPFPSVKKQRSAGELYTSGWSHRRSRNVLSLATTRLAKSPSRSTVLDSGPSAALGEGSAGRMAPG